MSEDRVNYERFLKKKTDEYMVYLKSIFKDAVDHHMDHCDVPYPVNFFCAKAFLEHFMQDFSEEVDKRQKATAAQVAEMDKQIEKVEVDLLTQIFGPPFDPRNN